ncbi:PREDICTED: sperm-associated antigen 4 protein-like isoform X1 [Chinchilla lanigera]|uniref:sperm-associated antigen 4 protein-like isoform X1 n=1 Tax=Chinchilla lanigera TaxID=34839 RepID=UPI00038EED33|nr:PREDICTED: sperm-associated antigen 4 protein-like isoform X1 [Chinchilla lanigera]
MRRSTRSSSVASSDEHMPNFYSNSSDSVPSGDCRGRRSPGPGPGEPESRRARGASCGEPALRPGLPGGTPWAGSSPQEPAPRSHNRETARGAATVRGGASVSEEQRNFLATLDPRRETPAPRATKSFLSLLFQVPRVLLSLVRDVLLGVCREVCCVRFLFAVSLLSIFLAAHSWGLLHLFPPLENEPKAMLTPSEYHERVRSHGQQLQQLQAELNKLRTEVARVRAAHSERVAKLVFQRLNEDFVQKPDYALSSVGATIDLEKTSQDYEDTNTSYFWNQLSFWNYARPPTVILEPDVFPGNCWAFQGDQGQVVIQLAGRVQLSDITLQHPPPSVAHTGDASSAPRDFSVFGLQVDDETEVFLGRFTFDVKKSAIQTFHLQNDPPSAFPKVKIQILSNWGHPRFTCLYRVRAHGLRISGGPH